MNPALSVNTFSQVRVAGAAEPMTLQGTVNKSAILLALVAIPAMYTWQKAAENPAGAMPLMLSGALVGFIMAMVTCFNMSWAPVTAPLYAVCEGLFLGAISAFYEARFNGLVLQAVMLTFGTLFGLLGAYSFGLVRATEKFKLGVIAATGGICLVYFVSIILGLFHISIPFIHSNGMLGIGFSVFVVIIAALNLVIDFDVIEQGCARGAPKYMEWYGAFGLLVTLVWLYLEILRLLSKLNRRD